MSKEILKHRKNLGEGFHQPPPPPLNYGGGVTLLVRPKVKLCSPRRCFATLDTVTAIVTATATVSCIFYRLRCRRNTRHM